MFKENKLTFLYMLFGACLITSNCIASKVADLGFSLFGNPVTLTTGVIVYPFTFLITDIIGENYGKHKAKVAVAGGFLCQVVSLIFIVVARYIPCVSEETQGAYNILLGQTFMFVLASLTAYLISQTVDVKIFHAIRESYIKKHGSTKGGKWIWNNVGTITSQLIDSFVYAIIAFGIGFGWLWNNVGALFNMILAQFLIKAIIALLDTPLFYLFTRKEEHHE